MNFRTIFFNDAGRIRSGWRFTIFLLSFFLASGILLLATTAVLMNLPIGFSPYSLVSFVMQFGISFAVVMFFGWLYGKIFEDLPFRALGFWFTKGWLKNLILGFILGAASIALAALIAYAFGGLSFRANDGAGSAAVLLTLGTTFLIFVVGAAFEEAFLRGYALQTFARSGLAAFGIILTSLIFASMHNGNPGANPLSWLNTFLAGIWFAVAYFKTRDLWFPFALHLAWNWFQGSIFGINVSGLETLAPAPLMKAADHGPAWLTGAGYGLEGGVACTAALVASTALIYFLPVFKPSEEMLAFSSAEKPVESLSNA
ncbi:MAG TPA: type II CAAX endopeptidase family protein [Pyrinomonadaceae bacterium]|jgi:membrane protease YdiL (CAAX protease family)